MAIQLEYLCTSYCVLPLVFTVPAPRPVKSISHHVYVCAFVCLWFCAILLTIMKLNSDHKMTFTQLKTSPSLKKSALKSLVLWIMCVLRGFKDYYLLFTETRDSTTNSCSMYSLRLQSKLSNTAGRQRLLPGNLAPSFWQCYGHSGDVLLQA